MTELCRNQLHVKPEPGPCRECKAARDRRYRATEKGKQEHRRSQARYAHSLKGALGILERRTRLEARRRRAFFAGLTGGQV